MSRPYEQYRISADTTPEAERLLFRMLARKTPADKLKMVSKMNATVRSLAMFGLREQHPDETEQQLRVRLAEQLYGNEIARLIAERLKDSARG